MFVLYEIGKCSCSCISLARKVSGNAKNAPIKFYKGGVWHLPLQRICRGIVIGQQGNCTRTVFVSAVYLHVSLLATGNCPQWGCSGSSVLPFVTGETVDDSLQQF